MSHIPCIPCLLLDTCTCMMDLRRTQWKHLLQYLLFSNLPVRFGLSVLGPLRWILFIDTTNSVSIRLACASAILNVAVFVLNYSNFKSFPFSKRVAPFLWDQYFLIAWYRICSSWFAKYQYTAWCLSFVINCSTVSSSLCVIFGIHNVHMKLSICFKMFNVQRFNSYRLNTVFLFCPDFIQCIINILNFWSFTM